MALKSLVFSALFFLLFPFVSYGAPQGSSVRHSLDIKVDIPGHSISGVDRMTIDSAPSEVSLIIRKGSEITKVESGQASLPFEIAEGDNFRQIKVKAPVGGSLRELRVHFQRLFPVSERGAGADKARGRLPRGRHHRRRRRLPAVICPLVPAARRELRVIRGDGEPSQGLLIDDAGHSGKTERRRFERH